MLARLKTALVVVVLSVLIWVFAERQVTQMIETDAVVALPRVTENLLVQFLNENDIVVSDTARTLRLTVKGPAGRVQALRNETIHVELSDLPVPADADSEIYKIDVIKEIFQGRLETPKGPLNVITAEPPYIGVLLTRLEPQSVPVQVRDQYGNELDVDSLVPSQLTLNVTPGQTTPALVTLTDEQMRLAARQPIVATARAFHNNRILDEASVQIRLTPGGAARPTTEILRPRLGFLIPPNLAGRIRIAIESGSESDQDPIIVRGPTLAGTAYKNSSYHLLLEIYERDLAETGPISRPLRYLLPENYQDELEIENPQQRITVFRLEKIE